MNKLKFLAKELLILTTLSLMLAAPIVHATPPTTISGTFVLTSFTVTSVRHADGNTIETFTDTVSVFGDISGTDVEAGVLVIHPDGTATFHNSVFETVSVLGGPIGTFSGESKGKIFSDGRDEGVFTIGDGTGGLAGVHGVASFHTPTVGSPFDVYSGQVHFEGS